MNVRNSLHDNVILYLMLRKMQIFPYEQLLVSNFTLPAGVERMTVEVESRDSTSFTITLQWSYFE